MTYNSVILADNPVMFLPDTHGANGAVIVDASGNGHNGTIHNTIASTTFKNGDTTGDFNGATNYIEVPDHSALSISTTGSFTVEAWIRPDVYDFVNTQGDDYVWWMGKNTPNQSEYSLRMYNRTHPTRPQRISDYAFNLAAIPPATSNLGAGSYFQDVITAGTWIHVVAAYTTVGNGTYPDGYIKIYRDGVLRMTEDMSYLGVAIHPANGTAPFRIGTATLMSWFNGAIAKVAAYNYQLTATQVAAHHNAA